MLNYDFDPVVGEEVRVLGRPGEFKIEKVYCVPDNQIGIGTVDLRNEKENSLLRAVSWVMLEYPNWQTRRVRCLIEWLKKVPEHRMYPSYIVDYEVEARNDHAGNPSIFVRFLIDPDYFYENGRPSEEKIAALNAFAYEVKQRLLDLGLDRWTYVQTSEAQRVLDVAC